MPKFKSRKLNSAYTCSNGSEVWFHYIELLLIALFVQQKCSLSIGLQETHLSTSQPFFQRWVLNVNRSPWRRNHSRVTKETEHFLAGCPRLPSRPWAGHGRVFFVLDVTCWWFSGSSSWTWASRGPWGCSGLAHSTCSPVCHLWAACTACLPSWLWVMSTDSQTHEEGKRHHAVISKQVQSVQREFPSQIAVIAANRWATLVFADLGHSYETNQALPPCGSTRWV